MNTRNTPVGTTRMEDLMRSHITTTLVATLAIALMAAASAPAAVITDGGFESAPLVGDDQTSAVSLDAHDNDPGEWVMADDGGQHDWSHDSTNEWMTYSTSASPGKAGSLFQWVDDDKAITGKQKLEFDLDYEANGFIVIAVRLERR
jgi:hypothetical protein